MIVQPLASTIHLIETISVDPLADISAKKLKTGRQGLETTLLIQTIGKIASLVKIGFGVAGADIIRRNLHESENFKLNLFGSGNIVSCIFVFCDIRNFTDTTECLQEEVMVFVNKIACILHSLTSQCGGAPNKNVGDAFLLLWKIEEAEVAEWKGEVAGKCLYCILKFTCELMKRHSDVCSFSTAATQRLYQRMPDYRPKVGFGLHKGWAVEGAIGSDQKIDVSYISPDVAYVEFLQDLTKDYGCTVLFSASFFHLLPSQVQYHCRQLDCITRPSEEQEAIDIYTYDCNVEAMITHLGGIPEVLGQQPPSVERGCSATGQQPVAQEQPPPTTPRSLTPNHFSRHKSIGTTRIPIESPRTFPIRSKSPQETTTHTRASPSGSIPVSPSQQATPRKTGGQQSNQSPLFLDIKIPKYYKDIWDEDEDLKKLRSELLPGVRTTWNFAVSSYLAGKGGNHAHDSG